MSADQYDKQIQDLEKTYAKYGRRLDEATRSELEYLAASKRVLEVTRERIVDLQRWKDLNLERPRWAEDKNWPRNIGIEPSTGEETRPRRTTDELRNKMRRVAEDLSNLISDSIHTGFRDGMKAGLAEFALGILQMLESKLLNKLTDAITDALMKGFGGAGTSGGGFLGFFSKWLLPILGGGLGGIFAGGGGHGGGTIGAAGKGIPIPHAMGGILTEPIIGFGLHSGRMHSFAEHGPETVVPGVGRSGINQIIHFHFNGAAPMSRETERQVADRYRRLMQKSALAA